MTNYPLSRKTNIVVQELENEVLIYDLTINKAYCLNQTSALVYLLADGTKTVSEISESMSIKSKTPVSEDFVWLALEGLKKAKLLEFAEELISPFGGLTRREAVKKAGLASMAMLPIIASVAAPSAAMAASGTTPLFSACASPGTCDPGLTCTTCTGGNCTGSNCCVGSGTRVGMGGVVSLSSQPDCATCTALAANSCCSGSVGLGACNPQPGGTSCIFSCQ